MASLSQTTTILTAASGEYNGNDTANRAIPHTLGVTPRHVRILDYAGQYTYDITAAEGTAVKYQTNGAAFSELGVVAMDATNFYVGNAGDYYGSANKSGRAYQWVAIR